MTGITQQRPTSPATPAAVPPSRAPRRSLLRHRTVRLAVGWAFLLLLLVLWEVAGRRDQTGLLPPVSAVLNQIGSLVTGDSLTQDVLPSLGRAVAGFLLGSLLGIALGVVLGWWRWLDPWTRAPLEFLRAVPAPALVPIAVVTFGSTSAVKVCVIALGALWPVLLNTTDGIRRVDAGYIDSARVYTSGTSAAVVRRVVLPAATPQIMTGLRTGLAISLVLMVISEMIGASSGLGYVILQSQRLYALTTMYAGVVVLGLIGVALTALFARVERRATRWFEGMKGRTNG